MHRSRILPLLLCLLLPCLGAGHALAGAEEARLMTLPTLVVSTPTPGGGTPTPGGGTPTPVPETPTPGVQTPTPDPGTPTPGTPTPGTPTPGVWTPAPPPDPVSPTPVYDVPETDDITDLWTVMFLSVGICAIGGIVLITVARAHKKR